MENGAVSIAWGRVCEKKHQHQAGCPVPKNTKKQSIFPNVMQKCEGQWNFRYPAERGTFVNNPNCTSFSVWLAWTRLQSTGIVWQDNEWLVDVSKIGTYGYLWAIGIQSWANLNHQKNNPRHDWHLGIHTSHHLLGFRDHQNSKLFYWLHQKLVDHSWLWHLFLHPSPAK